MRVRRKEVSEKELFEEMPVAKAVATLAIPTVISQVVTMIYNLADTFFVGQIGNPYMVAAVSLVSPWFNLLTALGNLFGLGNAFTFWQIYFYSKLVSVGKRHQPELELRYNEYGQND